MSFSWHFAWQKTEVTSCSASPNNTTAFVPSRPSQWMETLGSNGTRRWGWTTLMEKKSLHRDWDAPNLLGVFPDYQLNHLFWGFFSSGAGFFSINNPKIEDIFVRSEEMVSEVSDSGGWFFWKKNSLMFNPLGNSHIPPREKGNSSTQKCLGGRYVNPLEGNPWRVVEDLQCACFFKLW